MDHGSSPIKNINSNLDSIEYALSVRTDFKLALPFALI